jgi:G3E family GTPase
VLVENNCKDILSKHGIKATRQRCLTLDVLSEAESPLSAEAIYLNIMQRDSESTINLSTVYRVLELLVEKRIAIRIADFETGKAVFELSKLRHKHHLTCTQCKRMVFIDDCPVSGLVNNLEKETDFNITGHVLEMYGLCKECRHEGAERGRGTMQKVKVDVISGFLGAGKTTLIKKLITEGLSSERLVIIENEFGEVGIDGALLQGPGIEVREISAGCICCTVVGDFEKAIMDIIKKFDSSRIIIEPSGVGKLSEILKVLESQKVKSVAERNMVITVVDVSKYDMYIRNFGEFFGDQVASAGTVVLSRTQNASAAKIEQIFAKIHAINPGASIVTTPWDQLDVQKLIAVAEGKDEELLCACGCSNQDHHHHHDQGECACTECHDNHKHEHNNPFESWNAMTPKRYSEDEIRNILEAFADTKEYGLVLRSKGILESSAGGWIQFHYVPGEITVAGASPDVTGRLCVIGQKLNRQSIDKAFGLS